MATLVLTNAQVVLSSNDLTDHVQGVRLNYEAEQHDDTAMGDSARSMKGGLKVWDFDIELMQDWAGSNIDSILFPLVGTQVTVAVRPTSSARSATNPDYIGTCLVVGYPPIGGVVGDLATTTLKLVNAGTLSRTTSST